MALNLEGKTIHQLMLELCATTPNQYFERQEIAGEVLLRVNADAQALADVRTLDDWATHVEGRYYATGKAFGLDVVKLHDPDLWGSLGKAFDGSTPDKRPSTPDEARAKAAAWVREQKAGT